MADNSTKSTRRMPNGELTDDVHEYLDSWQVLCSAMEKKGLEVISFDPGMTVKDKDSTATCSMPFAIVEKIFKNSAGEYNEN